MTSEQSKLRHATRLFAGTVGLLIVLIPGVTLAADEAASRAPQGSTETKPAGLTVSTFKHPANPAEGRDPFYPTSLRPMVKYSPVPDKVVGRPKLELKGISGTPDRPLAIINNRTLGVGEEQNVTTPQGRVKVMCLEIQGTRVKVRAQGEVQELMLRKGI